MAVPKKKRYKQIVRSRRSLKKENTLLNRNISITKFRNYANTSTSYTDIAYCNICKSNDFANKLCASCYVLYFLNFYHKKKEIKNRKSNFRIRYQSKEFSKKYYYELSKTFFSSSRP
jgi:ribosomal protein L32